MLEFRFKNIRTLLCVAKLSLIEARKHAQDVHLHLYHEPKLLLWGLSLEGQYPKDSTPTLYYEMLFTIHLSDRKISDEDILAPFLKSITGKNGLTESLAAIQKLEHTPLLTIDPENPPPVPDDLVYSHQTVLME